MNRGTVIVPLFSFIENVNWPTPNRLRRLVAFHASRLSLIGKVRVRRLHLRFRKLRLRYPLALRLTLILAISACTFVVIAARWKVLGNYLDSLDHTVFPALAMAIAAAMLGVIGIVFSLSIFSVQQVADRGTTVTLKEYANDWVLRAVFWVFALFACSAAGVSLLSTRKPFTTIGVMIDGVILVLTCLLLKVYFNRAILFADAHYTIKKMDSRAKRELARVAKILTAMQDEYKLDKRAKRRAKTK